MHPDMEKLANDIERETKRGMHNPQGTGVLDGTIRQGRAHIKHHDRVWQENLLDSFRAKLVSNSKGRQLWQIVNDEVYAEAHDQGTMFRAPPPPENLEPWVADHMFAFPGYTDPRRAAGALSQHLYRNGLTGIFFTNVMIQYLRWTGEQKLEQHLNRNL